MSSNKNNSRGKSENELSDIANELIEKGKDLANKAEEFFTEKYNQVKEGEAYEKFSGLIGQVESFMEDKSEKFQSVEIGSKFDAFIENTENQASEFLKKAKAAGRKIGDQIDDSLDDLKGKKDRTNNQDGDGI